MERMTPQEQQNPNKKRPLRPEVLLGLLVLAATALFLTVLVLCIPHLHKEETDPQFLLQSTHVQQERNEKEKPVGVEEPMPEETVEPTIEPEANPYGRRDFQYDRHNYLYCMKQDSYSGVDVSAFQGEIDWPRVRKSGIQFAMVRLGYRGYGAAGTLVVDEFVEQNLQGATEAGIALGAYFFSQATNIQEVDEEIDFMLDILGDYHLDMPIVLDWEYISETARTAKVDRRTLTDCLLHFCQVMEEKGYNPMIYFNWNQSTRMLYLHELEDYPFWLALYQDRMEYPYRVEMWQYTCTGRVPGINGDVDINVFMPDLRMRNG